MINRIKIAMVIFGALLVAMIGSTLWLNYNAQMELRQSATAQLRHEVERQAVNLEYFFTERKDDLKDLAGSRELSVFFENKALNMSMAYGLRASLLAISQKLEDVLAHKRFYDNPIYTRLLFLDQSGETLIDINPRKMTADPGQWRSYRTPDTGEIFISEVCQANRPLTIISAGYFFKGHYAGQLIAVLSPRIIFDLFFKPESEHSRRRFGLLCQHGFFHDGTSKQTHLAIRPAFGKDDTGMVVIEQGDLADNPVQTPSLVVQIPVKGTPYSIATITPVAAILGSTPPWYLSLIMGILTIIIISGIGVLWQLNTRNTVLHTRLEETAKRESAIKKYQQNLERMVEARTRDLKMAQSKLISKAMEAGRAQLSAMVLHNIGNALTPMGVFMSSVRENEVHDTLGYLHKCYAEMKTHADHLAEFLTQSPRGLEIFDFMGQLIANLQDVCTKHWQTQKKIAGAFGYISDIITMQQAYAASEHEVKRQIDLNKLVEDAIHMQAGALDKRGIIVERILDPNLSPLIIDKNRLMQVMVNVVKNGYEAIDQLDGEAVEKRMTFCTYADTNGICLAISDTGVGIDPQVTPRLFEFGHSGKGSSGFGLYYCKMFMEANQGTMAIDSPGVGRGATVSIHFYPSTSRATELPMKADPASAAALTVQNERFVNPKQSY